MADLVGSTPLPEMAGAISALTGALVESNAELAKLVRERDDYEAIDASRRYNLEVARAEGRTEERAAAARFLRDRGAYAYADAIGEGRHHA